MRSVTFVAVEEKESPGCADDIGAVIYLSLPPNKQNNVATQLERRGAKGTSWFNSSDWWLPVFGRGRPNDPESASLLGDGIPNGRLPTGRVDGNDGALIRPKKGHFTKHRKAYIATGAVLGGATVIGGSFALACRAYYVDASNRAWAEDMTMKQRLFDARKGKAKRDVSFDDSELLVARDPAVDPYKQWCEKIPREDRYQARHDECKFRSSSK